MITPTVGRVVWYRGTAGDSFPGSRGTCAAIVSHVWSDRMVNLCVIDSNGDTHSRTSVVLIQGGETPPTDCAYCEWMPYQKGQAAKTEALEKQAASLS